MNNPLRNLPARLVAENGGAFGFVCIWRPGNDGDSARRCTVGAWLAEPEHQSGSWLIDGGWGGPPGPIHVAWDATQQAWENRGFLASGVTPDLSWHDAGCVKRYGAVPDNAGQCLCEKRRDANVSLATSGEGRG